MADENEHLAMLSAARSLMIAQRREVVIALTEKYKRAHTDDMRELLGTDQAPMMQLTCAIERKNIASAHAPQPSSASSTVKNTKDTRASPRVGASP
jgi:hypothetical protein